MNEVGTMPSEKVRQRNVERRCPICDRGHMCFSTPADLEPALQDTPHEVAIGTRITLAYNTVGSWHGSKSRLLAGTVVTIKNLHTQDTGELRAMVELDDGDVYWVGVNQLLRG